MITAALPWADTFSQLRSENMLNPHSVTTFECAAVYWKTQEDGTCKIRYREETGITGRMDLTLFMITAMGNTEGVSLALNQTPHIR